ncbi:MAG: DUF1501 domain-containing protein [Planctomycetaceae bacterium]|nr:DUF1501 domain-containing protein [Planctomycetaceae bacterium]
MLSILEQAGRHGRREFLKIGGLSLGGLSLADLLSVNAQSAALARAVKDRSVVFLFMHGGPSQVETFDPKMDAPTGIRSATGEIQTSLPGVTFGSTFEKLAPLADRFSIVRSFTTGDANHDIKPIVCKDTLGANLGSLYARIVGTNHPASGMPTNAAIFPRSVDPTTQPKQDGFGRFESTGTVGSAYAPFTPGAGDAFQKNLELTMARDRLDDRRLLLQNLDRIRRQIDATGGLTGLDRFRDQAFEAIVGGVADAFDLSKEDPATLARYDTAPLLTPDRIDPKWNNYKFYCDHNKSLGKLMLLSRRLVERGCGFVTVTTNFVWDMHADVNNAPVTVGMRYCGGAFDHAVSAFIEDLESRGLGNKVLLVCCGEMGRTPRINNTGGRDHWGSLAPLLIYGGGLTGGKVIGQSNRNAGEPQTDPIGLKHLIATVLGTLFDVSELRLIPGTPSDIIRAASHEAIPGLGIA